MRGSAVGDRYRMVNGLYIVGITLDVEHTRASAYSSFDGQEFCTLPTFDRVGYGDKLRRFSSISRRRTPMADLVPLNAWDNHIHVFDPDNYPYGSNRSYTPKAAQLSEYPKQITGCENIVIVHASVQGSSFEPLLDTLSKEGKSSFPDGKLRGLATIIPQDVDDSQLDKLHAAGVRGARLHKMSWGHGAQSGVEDIINNIKAISSKTARVGWVISIFCPLAAWAAMADDLRQLDPRTKIIADHFGAAFPGSENTVDFRTFLKLIREKKIYVKISAFERLYHGHAKGWMLSSQSRKLYWTLDRIRLSLARIGRTLVLVLQGRARMMNRD